MLIAGMRQSVDVGDKCNCCFHRSNSSLNAFSFDCAELNGSYVFEQRDISIIPAQKIAATATDESNGKDNAAGTAVDAAAAAEQINESGDGSDTAEKEEAPTASAAAEDDALIAKGESPSESVDKDTLAPAAEAAEAAEGEEQRDERVEEGDGKEVLGTCLECVGPVKRRIVLQPSSLDSDIHARMTLKHAERFKKERR